MKKKFTIYKKASTSFAIGLLISFNSYAQTAKMQFIHNSADPAVASLDVYLNDVLLIDNFPFRDASEFLDAPVDAPTKISIAPSSSTSSAEKIEDFTITFAPGAKYILVINGVMGSGFEANPDGRPTGFTLLQFNAAKDASTNPANVELSGLHGATDVAIIDVLMEGGTTLSDNKAYGDFSGYTSVSPGIYTIYVTDYPNTDTLAIFTGDFSSWAGKTAMIFSSGFFSTANDNNGPSFGLYAALSDGTVVPLTTVSIAGLFHSLTTFQNVSVYPLPSAGGITLQLDNSQTESAYIEVVNRYGQVTHQKKVILIPGSNQIPMNLSDLNAGEYWIRIAGSDRLGSARCLILK